MLIKTVNNKMTACERREGKAIQWSFKDVHLRDGIRFQVASDTYEIKTGKDNRRGWLLSEDEAYKLLDALTEWARGVRSGNAIKPGELGDWATLP